MSQNLINAKIKEFNSIIESAISKHKPSATGTKGTISYVAGYLKSYTDKLANCITEVTHKGNELLTKFKEEKPGEGKKLSDELKKAIHETMGRFKKKYWS